jgi:hypothetical protein
MKQKPNIWITLILAAILVGGFSFITPKNEEKYKSGHFWSHKTFAPAKFDIVILGDSRVYRGVSPEKMKEILPGAEILNFAYSNGSLNPVIFNAAEEKLSQNRNKKIIVLGISANTVTGFSQGNEQYFQELTRPKEEVLERLYLNPVLYWFSATSPENLKNLFLQKKDSSFYTNKYFLNGYVASEKFPVDTTEAIPYYEDDFSKFKVEGRYLQPLMEQVAAWSQKGILVVAFRPPVSLSMQNLEDSVGMYNEELIKSGIQNSGGFWVDLNFSDYKTYDGSHLNIESANYLSEVLAKRINELITFDSPVE